MPERILEKLKKSINPQIKICFIFAFVIGIITHLYKITNWLPNWDSLVFRYDGQNMIALGRWFLPVVCAPSSFYDLPLIAGLIAIIFHALGASCIVKMFGVKKNITAALIGSLVASFPAVTSVMMYNYVADGYAIAFFLSCLAAMLMTKDKPSYIIPAILIALSSGIYQAYITVTITLLILYLIFEILNNKIKLKDTYIKTLKLALCGAMGMGLYYFLFTIILKITKTEILAYQGFDNAVSLSGIDIPGALYVIKHTLTDYFFDFSNGFNTFAIINILIFSATVILYVVNIIKNKFKVTGMLSLILYVILLPIGVCVLAFINSSIDYHNLMKMGFLVFYLFMILQYENVKFKNMKFVSVKSWVILILMTALIFNHIIIANVSYHKLNMAYEKSYGTLIRLADRIEQTEGNENCDSILIIGHFPDSEAYSVNLPPDMTGATDGSILRADDEIVGQSVLCSALNDYCGKDYKFISGKEKEEIIKNNNLENLQNWPKGNSVSVIDNVIIIKLSDKEQNL